MKYQKQVHWAAAFGAVALPFFLVSCASPAIQPRVNSLVVSQKLDQAAIALTENPRAYGKNNELLYWLDRGMVEQCLGQYQRSIYSFSQAQRKFEQLYTQSISKMVSAWALNDYAAPYRGEDYEYTLLNIFQAINYLMLGDTNEALVEARDMDSKLSLINSLYGGKNIYKDDAFGRFFMGILYEANRLSEDLNHAFISYVKAYQIYQQDEGSFFNAEPPELLKENLLSLAHFMGNEQFQKYRAEFPDAAYVSLQDKKSKAQVYLIQYTGFSPVKISGVVPIPFDPRHVTQVVFPRYLPRYSQIEGSSFSAQPSEQLSYVQPTFVGHDIGQLAVKVLESRRVEIMAKALTRPAVKYAAERVIEDQIQDKWGEAGAVAFNVLSSIYNLSTERADLRSWQTLPAQIRLARLFLNGGEYEFFVHTYDKDRQPLNKISLGKHKVKAGETKFFLFRNYR